MSVLVIAEHDNQNLKAATLSTITAASKFNQPIKVLVMGDQSHKISEELIKIKEVSETIVCDSKDLKNPLAELLAPIIVEQAKAMTHILAPATSFGKNVLPRVAALLDVGQISDVTKIIDDQTFERPIYAGNAIATVRSLDPIKIMTIRTTAFEAAEIGENTHSDTPIKQLEAKELGREIASNFISAETHANERPELSSANIVISGGRGLQNEATFERLSKIADRLGAAIGASRAAVDAGLAPNDWQVGQTGQIVAPKLYIAVGISGAIQHLAGMKDSKIIVAINKDADAPIFQIADYGLVADLNDILPEWESALSDLGY